MIKIFRHYKDKYIQTKIALYYINEKSFIQYSYTIIDLNNYPPKT